MKKDNNSSGIDKYCEDIDTWGVLSLLRYFKTRFDAQADKERMTILMVNGHKYEGSALANHDKLVQAINRTYDREVKTIYDALKAKHDAKGEKVKNKVGAD